MRLCFVVQRYGREVAGGAELHARWLAGRLARRHQVQVVTTCALDYLEWRNHYPPGDEVVDGVAVRRYPVRRPRSDARFSRISDRVFHEAHTLADEREWVEENGPVCPELVRALPGMTDVDLFLFYSYRYYQSFFGLPAVASRSVLVPTAEEDPAIELPVFRELFGAPRGLLFLTPEERDLVRDAGGADVPCAVIGSGVEVPEDRPAVDVRARFGLDEPYVLYVGRIDRNKGADRLFAHHRQLCEDGGEAPLLALAGKAALEVPVHPRVRHLGFVTEGEKFALLDGCEALVMPSRYESLSLIVLEAWAVGRPVLANAECRVLQGQCVRSGGGLFYRGFPEFAACLRRLHGSPGLRTALGEAGRAYVRREYDWAVVEEKTSVFLEGLRPRP